MDELRELLARAERIAATGERLGAAFARELSKVWRDVERELVQLVVGARPGSVTDAIRATRAVVLKEQIRAVLSQAGYDRLVASATQLSAEVMVEAVLTRAAIAEIASLTPSMATTLEALRQIAATDLLGAGDEVATALWRSLAQQVFTTRPTREIVQDLADVLDLQDAEVQTLYDTQVSVYGRHVEALNTATLPDDQPYLYVGPIDDVTRPFCLQWAGKVLTRAEIDDLDNDQLPNPFLTAGGYNCRHSWLAVESRELREMAGTGQRVPEVADDIARAKARREARRKKAA